MGPHVEAAWKLCSTENEMTWRSTIRAHRRKRENNLQITRPTIQSRGTPGSPRPDFKARKKQKTGKDATKSNRPLDMCRRPGRRDNQHASSFALRAADRRHGAALGRRSGQPAVRALRVRRNQDVIGYRHRPLRRGTAHSWPGRSARFSTISFTPLLAQRTRRTRTARCDPSSSSRPACSLPS